MPSLIAWRHQMTLASQCHFSAMRSHDELAAYLYFASWLSYSHFVSMVIFLMRTAITRRHSVMLSASAQPLASYSFHHRNVQIARSGDISCQRHFNGEKLRYYFDMINMPIVRSRFRRHDYAISAASHFDFLGNARNTKSRLEPCRFETGLSASNSEILSRMPV